MVKLNQKGVIHYLLLIAALALVAFIVFSSTASFKDKLFAQLFPKKSSFASGLSNPTPSPSSVYQRWIWPNIFCSNTKDPNCPLPYQHFDTLFANEADWQSILQETHVFGFFMNTILNNSGNFLQRAIPLFRKYNIKIVSDGGWLGFGGCGSNDGFNIAQ